MGNFQALVCGKFFFLFFVDTGLLLPISSSGVYIYYVRCMCFAYRQHQAITNHAETASKLSKSISQVANLLPQHSLHLILYPTPQMQVSVARIYACILNFFLSALKWYRDSRAVHAVKSIFQPWDLKFRPEYEAIAIESQQIKRLANVALKAEVRDTRLEVVQGTKHLEKLAQQNDELRRDNQRLADLFKMKFEMMESAMLSE